jgi:arylsulfatase
LFEEEAQRNQLLPLGAGIGTRRALPSEVQTRFAFQSGAPGIPIASRLAPDLRKSHTISARIRIPPAGASGVILAAGGRSSGMVPLESVDICVRH